MIFSSVARQPLSERWLSRAGPDGLGQCGCRLYQCGFQVRTTTACTGLTRWLDWTGDPPSFRQEAIALQELAAQTCTSNYR